MEEYNIDDVSERQLKFGAWYLSNQEKIKKGIIIILAVFCAITLGYGIFGFAYHYINQGKLDRELAQIGSLDIDFASFQLRNKAENIIFFEPEVIYTGNNSYDIYTKVKNPNSRWLVKELTYQFIGDDFTGPTTTIYLLPNEERYLFSLANQSPKRLADMAINIIAVKWQRSNIVADLPQIDFVLSKVNFFVSDNEAKSWANFTVENKTNYNFWEVTWQALLYSGRQIVGLNQIQTNEFEAGQKREVEMSWYERLPRVSTVEVFPVVDLLNPDIIYKIPGQAQSLY